MDLRLYFRVLWRYRPLMIYGACVALLLALLAGARITTHGIEARGTTTWSSTATLLITHENDVASFAGRVVRLRDGRIISDERRSPAPAPAPALREVAS